MVHEKPKDWANGFHWLNGGITPTFHSSTHTTPYEIVYGQPAPIHMPYLSGHPCVDIVDKSLQAREATINLMKFYLQRAGNHMKQQTYKKRNDREFFL